MIKKRETVEEYLARGGKIQVCPTIIPEREEPAIKSTVGGLPKIMDLSEGAFYFGESKKKKKEPISTEKFMEKIDSTNLPPEVIASLKKSIGAKDE